jgi:hypothetical protein
MADSEDTGDGSYTDTTTAGDASDGVKEGTEGEDGEEKKPGDEEEEHKEPEPEPEPDPLEGLTYEDDPDSPVPPYGDSAYWEQRYTEDTEVFEWYQDPDAILPVIKEYLEGEGVRALVVGTGNSNLAPQLAQQGLEAVVAIDYVKPCIVKSRRRNRDIENVVWKVMDVRKLTLPDGDFQIVLDKGTLDCLFFRSVNDSSRQERMANVMN